MYPFIRMAKEAFKFRNAPALTIFGTHVSQHVCWPWDIDPWLELNNGRTLTLYDLGRVPLSMRTGLARALKDNRWGMVVAGNTTRYRRRVKTFQRFEMRTRCIGWDARFLYLEQSMWSRGECSSHIMIRGAVTSGKGIVPPAHVAEAMGLAGESPALPGWVQTWSQAESERPWPPQM